MTTTPRTASMAAFLAPMLLAGCGGGDGGNIASTPTPPFPLAKTTQFSATTATTGYTGTLASGLNGSNATVTPASTSGQSAATAIAYDAATATYTVQANAISASFAAADKTTSSGYATDFAKSADTLTLYGNAQGNSTASAPVTLSYTSLAKWSHTDTASQHTDITYFLFGTPTTSTSMPTSGTASYNAIVAATKLSYNYAPTTGTALTGTASLTADFTKGTVDTTLSLQPAGTGGFAATTSYTGTGTITASNFAGAFSTGPTDFASGTFTGGFYGPAAAEMGYAFALKLHNLDPFSGASVEPGDATIAGVAVGSKK